MNGTDYCVIIPVRRGGNSNQIGVLTATYNTQLSTDKNVLFSKSQFNSNNVLREMYLKPSKLLF